MNKITVDMLKTGTREGFLVSVKNEETGTVKTVLEVESSLTTHLTKMEQAIHLFLKAIRKATTLEEYSFEDTLCFNFKNATLYLWLYKSLDDDFAGVNPPPVFNTLLTTLCYLPNPKVVLDNSVRLTVEQLKRAKTKEIECVGNIMDMLGVE